MKFKKIVSVDHTKLQDRALEGLQQLSEQKIEVYDDYPDSEEEILKRIEGADAVLVSWHTRLDENIISQCPGLKYIGMACSLYDDSSANVAVNYARGKGIKVTGIKDYGDPGVAEFIISEVIRLLHGLGKHQWREMPEELTGRKIGIVGLGTTGKLLAKCLLPFGPDLYYFSRTRKEEWEKKGVKYLPLPQLLEKTEIISFHLPKNTVLLDKPEFSKLGKGKILINTSLGLPFKEAAFKDWIKEPGNFAIFDADGKKQLSVEVEKFFNVFISDKSAGWSSETEKRLSEKVIKNLRNYLDQ
ncbi:NAD(P)-dependent oxidoreductase [Salinimicrobium flavum]|uniref:NAD(P)-dependent oxidoreductase n=1 Tax=Salinimicrobium flavum TaxID=1737065 RepID=A0ABW5IZN1_9FLAO